VRNCLARLLTPYRFDVTPVPQAGEDSVDLGDILDEALNPVGRFTVPHSTLNRHSFICGATGSGKSQTARRLLESLTLGPRRVPWLAVEPAKAEYAAMAGRLAGRDQVLVIRPGELVSAPTSLNPLEPEPGFPLQSHADLVRALFLAAFEANEPFPQVLSHALTECYTTAGWNWSAVDHAHHQAQAGSMNPTNRRSPLPDLAGLQATARQVVDNIGYASRRRRPRFRRRADAGLRQEPPGGSSKAGIRLTSPGSSNATSSWSLSRSRTIRTRHS
jgi:hypothetical protein